ncbi:hypothetical protein D3C73_1651060 [compost metagenome]
MLNEVIMLSTNNTINTVMINETRPRVRKLIGKVNNLKIKPIVALARAIRMEAIMALP